MKCTKCGHDNSSDALFCTSCGAHLKREEGNGTGDTIEAAEEKQDEHNEDIIASGLKTVEESSNETIDHLGPFELLGELGRGAMARVWRARDPNLGREVAIKEPLFDSNLSESVIEEMGRRFVKEAQTAARLNHPGIVTIYAADVYDGNRPAIVMELVEGATLGEILEREHKLDSTTTLDALNQLLDAVGYAHEQGVVHRDIKPDNIFVNSEGRVKLADFGIAHVDDGRATRATQIGAVLGTPGYMSPEQARGATVDSRSDLFSIGVVGYEMLAGRNPFGAGEGGDTTMLLYRIVHEPPDELPDSVAVGLPTDIRPAIMAALAKDPNNRPQTAAEFKRMLQDGNAGSTAVIEDGSNLKGITNSAKAGKPPKWLPYVAVAVVCIVILLFALAMANRGSGGSQGASSPPQSNPTPTQSTQTNTQSTSGALAYLSTRNGHVAIYSNSSAEPYQVTDVAVADLNDEEAAEVNKRIEFSSIEEAETKVQQYRDAIKTRQETTTNKMYVVNCNEFITLRSQPDTSASELNRIPLGAQVDIIGASENGFAKVSYKGQTGYALANYLGSINSIGYETKLLRVVNCNEWISLRTAPNTSASTITRIPLGDSARYISTASNGFYQVSYNGQVGYALAEYLTEW